MAWLAAAPSSNAISIHIVWLQQHHHVTWHNSLHHPLKTNGDILAMFLNSRQVIDAVLLHVNGVWIWRCCSQCYWLQHLQFKPYWHATMHWLAAAPSIQTISASNNNAFMGFIGCSTFNSNPYQHNNINDWLQHLQCKPFQHPTMSLIGCRTFNSTHVTVTHHKHWFPHLIGCSTINGPEI